MIIAFLGKAGAGKDPACKYLSDNYDSVCLSFAEPLKDICYTTFNLSHGIPARAFFGTKEEKAADLADYDLPGWSGRKILQHIGTEGFRAVCPNIWTVLAKNSILEKLDTGTDLVVFTDTRFQTEVDMIHSLGGKVVKLLRNWGQEKNEGIQGHSSEMEMHNIEADFEIDNSNNTLEDFHWQLDYLMRQLGIERLDACV